MTETVRATRLFAFNGKQVVKHSFWVIYQSLSEKEFSLVNEVRIDKKLKTPDGILMQTTIDDARANCSNLLQGKWYANMGGAK